jgi:hypothetical protein
VVDVLIVRYKSMAHNTILLIVLLCTMSIGCKSKQVDSSMALRSKVAKISVGMKRSDVERILPSYSGGIGIGSGGSQTEIYFVDETWQVSVGYDYTGVPRDENGKALSSMSPDNRVLTAPVLSKRTNGHGLESKQIKSIEQAAPRNR